MERQDRIKDFGGDCYHLTVSGKISTYVDFIEVYKLPGGVANKTDRNKFFTIQK